MLHFILIHLKYEFITKFYYTRYEAAGSCWRAMSAHNIFHSSPVEYAMGIVSTIRECKSMRWVLCNVYFVSKEWVLHARSFWLVLVASSGWMHKCLLATSVKLCIYIMILDVATHVFAIGTRFSLERYEQCFTTFKSIKLHSLRDVKTFWSV